MTINNSLISLLLCLIIGCNVFDKQISIDKLSESEKNELYQVFKNKTIIFGGERDTSNIYIKTYDSADKINEYFLNLDENRALLLLRDTIQYDSDSSIFNPNTQKLNSSFINIVKYCKSLGIKGITSDWSSLGIDLKIYLTNGDVRLYVLNPENIKGKIWKSYFLKSKKISMHWYSSTE